MTGQNGALEGALKSDGTRHAANVDERCRLSKGLLPISG
jgi:hypothetical protein